MPVAVAGLLTFLLNPLVRLFERRLPRAAAVVLVVVLTFSVLGGLAWVLALQAASLGGEIPEYRDNLKRKIADVRGASRGTVIEKVQSATKEVVEELQKEDKPGKPAEKPLPVVVKSQPVPFWQSGRPASARTHRARPRPGDLHAAGALAASGSAHPRHRVRAYRHDHQGHGRSLPANQPLPDDADDDQRDLRPGRGARHAGDRPALCVPLGLLGRGAPVHPVRRALGGRRPRFAGRARRVRRMAPAASDRGAVRRAGAVHEPRAGDVLLQPERGRVPGGPPARGGVLDVDLGADWAGAGDAADGMPPGHGEVRARSRDGDDPAVGRAGDGPGPELLPAPGRA